MGEYILSLEYDLSLLDHINQRGYDGLMHLGQTKLLIPCLVWMPPMLIIVNRAPNV
jgi:hypothetical protein